MKMLLQGFLRGVLYTAGMLLALPILVVLELMTLKLLIMILSDPMMICAVIIITGGGILIYQGTPAFWISETVEIMLRVSNKPINRWEIRTNPALRMISGTICIVIGIAISAGY